MDHVARLSIGVCTHNRPGYLASCLDGLRRQTLPPRYVSLTPVMTRTSADFAAERMAHLSPTPALARSYPRINRGRSSGVRRR
jgi:GT2 family glycosyltransferase